MIRHWSIVATATAAALGLGGLALAQSNKPSDRGRETTQSGTASSMTTPQVAALVKNAKHSLADSISAAEKHCKGRAVRAECCRGADTDAVCVVTLLVGDNRLVEATVNTQSGKVISERDMDTLRFIGLVPSGSATNSADFAMARRWQKATDLKGKKVTNAAGEDLGQIEDVVADANSGRILYGVLSFGGLLGMGDKLFAIPWPSMRLSGDRKAFVLNVEKDRLTNAPGFAKDRWPNFADEQFGTTTYKYYDQTPYWLSQTGGVQLAADSSGGTPDNYRDRWNLRATAWQKTSDLCGKKVRSTQTDDVGKLSDLAIDPDSGRVLYGILSFRDKLFAIPWNALSLNSDAQHFVLSADKEQLTDTVSFSKDNWPNLVDRRWATETYVYYGIQPYWDGPMEGGADNP
jgi:sporulation protein YlmC with PRC-barrel domain